MTTFKAYMYTILGASCWGLIGLFVAPLYQEGFTAWEVVAIRGIVSFLCLFLIMAIWFRSQLRTRLKDHLIFAASGIVSIAFFNYFYFEVFARSNLSLAVTLLYTGPIFVALLSRLFFKEPLTKNKVVALFLSLIGCAFVVQLLPFGTVNIPGVVIGMGVLSGFFYALYSILTKPITKRYSPLTITTYTFLYTSVFMLLTSDISEKASAFTSSSVWIPALLLALVSTVAGYVFYTTGLTSLEASKASILATIEPVVAVLSSVLFLSDYMNLWQLLGILAVLYSAVLVSRSKNSHGNHPKAA